MILKIVVLLRNGKNWEYARSVEIGSKTIADRIPVEG